MDNNFCTTFLTQVSNIIEEANNNLTRQVINMAKNDYICVNTRTSFDSYSRYLKDHINPILQKNVTTCSGATAKFLIDGIEMGLPLVTNIKNTNTKAPNTNLKVPNIKGGGYDEFSDNGLESMLAILKHFFANCYCQEKDIFSIVVSSYGNKYFSKFENMSAVDAKMIMKEDYIEFKKILTDLTNLKIATKFNLGNKTFNLKDAIDPANISNIASHFSVRSELESLLPSELGAMKAYFVEIIASYYEQIHPIVWAQIFKGVCQNFFKEAPTTYEEVYAFCSKQLLTNSGPYILKILQLVRPILTPELKKKYNLERSSYPLMTRPQINMILEKILPDPNNRYQIKANFSASVGHVCLVNDVLDPRRSFILKIIKPLSIAQSCWEYSVLSKLFKKGSCEEQFVVGMIESNGKEMNVHNEKENIDKAYDIYTCDYNEIFGYSTGHSLTTLTNINGIIDDSCWYAMTVSIADGIPLSKLVENYDLLGKHNSSFVTSLHRCFDLLVFKFFYGFVMKGFYHGDLHAGNIFFSYEKKKMTLIDFGAVGDLDLFDNSTKEASTQMTTLVTILFKYLNNNYGEILDLLSDYVNTLCPVKHYEADDKVDKNSQGYKELREKLENFARENVKHESQEKEISKRNIDLFFSEETIEKEKYEAKINRDVPIKINSMYDYLNVSVPIEEIVEESKLTENIFDNVLEKSVMYSLVDILEEIFKFYAMANVNIAIKFGDLYEFQKAYGLILGVAKQIQYSGVRMSYTMNKAILNSSIVTRIIANLPTAIKYGVNYVKEKRQNKPRI